MSIGLLSQNDYCSKLVNFLANHLNTQFEKEITASGGRIPAGTLCVRSTRSYDAFNVPLSDFPLLKVYPSQDIFLKGGLFRMTNAVVTYAVSYPNLDELPNLLRWASWQINLGLLKYARTDNNMLPPPNNSGYTAEYLLTMSEALNTVYPFLRFNIQFKDHTDVKHYLI